jgi:hypothetical protein
VQRDGLVLLFDPDREHARQISRILRVVVPRIELLTHLDEIAAAPPAALFVLNYEAVPSCERAAVLDAITRRTGRQRLIACAKEWDRAELADLLGRHCVANLIAQANCDDSDELLVTLQKILRNDIFGIEKYFPWGSHTVTSVFRSSAERMQTLEAVGEFATCAGVIPRLGEQLGMVAEELTTNALYDAPVDAARTSRYAHLSRSEPITLLDDERIELKLCSDGRRVGISVSDPFGSLTRERVLDYLVKAYRMGADQIDEKQGGAGLGLYFAFTSLTHFIVNLHRHKRTEFIGLLDVRGTYKDFANRGKSLNIFVSE